MKRILFLLLLTVSVYGQNPSRFAKIQITGNTNSGTATKVNVQEANGEVNTQTINTGFNKNIGLGGSDVVGATTLLNQYSTTPVDWTATAFNSGQVVFYGGKQWIAKMATVAGDVPAVSSKWEEITFEALANKTVIVDAIPTGGSNNAVSSNGVFDDLATKANDALVVHLSGNETITGEKTIKNKLFFRNAANGLFLTIPELSTNFSAENTVLGVGAGSAIVPIQFNSPTYGLITGGTANTIFGQHAGNTLNAGNENTLIGHNAGYSLFLPVGNDPNFDSSLNTFIGSTAGYNVTLGYANTFIGQKAGVNVTESGHNVIIGKSAGGDGINLGAVLDGNIIIGSQAAKQSTLVRRSVIIGSNAGITSSGSDNVFLGPNAGDNANVNNSFISGSSAYPISNVYFGKGYANSTPTNYTINGTGGVGSEITGGNITIAGGKGTGLALGGDVIVQTSSPVIAGTQPHFLSEAFRVKATTGRIGVKTTSPTEQLEVVGNIKGTSFIKSGGLATEFLKADGSVSSYTNLISGTGTANLVAKWATSATQSNSIIQDDGTTVGVGTGTLSAGQKLQVFGNSSLTGSLSINNDGAVVSGFNSAGSTQSGFLTFNAFNGVSLASSNTNPVKFFVNGTENGRFFAGNLMVGTTNNTGERLQIAGTAKITGLTTLTVSPIITSETANTIASFDATKNVKSLSLSTYPSLSELAYVKGATSSIQTQIDSKAPTSSPTFTGTPTAPTAPAGTNTTQVATTAFVTNAVFDGLATKFPTPTGLTTNYLPKWNGSGFGNSQVFDNGTNVSIGGASTQLFGFGNFGGGVTSDLKIASGNTTYSNGFAEITNGSKLVFGYVNALGSPNEMASIQMFAESIANNNEASSLRFFTKTGANSVISNEKMRITPSGNTLFGKTNDAGDGVVQVNGNITASPAVSPNQVPTWGQVQAVAARPYKVYTALLSQSGTNAPTATVLENTLGGTVTWTRVSAGYYTATTSGLFTLDKTIIFTSTGTPFTSSANQTISQRALGVNTVEIYPRENNSGTDGLLSKTSIEIRVYN